MRTQIEDWLQEITRRIIVEFGEERILCLGIQGSHRRGEATKQSDIDLVMILDEGSMEDLKTYRSILRSMPDAEYACGFFSGKQELLHWPAQELFQFYFDTKVLLGSLEWIQNRITQDAVRQAVITGAGTLYHAACHSYLFENAEKNLRGLYKTAFFLLQAKEYLRTGKYYDTKAALLVRLNGEERHILQHGIEMQQERGWTYGREEIEEHYRQLIEWSGALLRNEGSMDIQQR